MRMFGIVAMHILDGFLHQLHGIPSINIYHVESQRRGCKPNGRTLLASAECLRTHLHILIAQMRHHKSMLEFFGRYLERKDPVCIGHGANVALLDGDIHMRQCLAGFLVLHNTRHEPSALCPRCGNQQPKSHPS